MEILVSQKPLTKQRFIRFDVYVCIPTYIYIRTNIIEEIHLWKE